VLTFREVMAFFHPRCPCDPAAKAWIEDRLGRLSRQFPANVFTDEPLVLPTQEHFPGRYDRTKATVGPLLERVCTSMGVAPSRVAIEFVDDAPSSLHLVDAGGRPSPIVVGTYRRGESARHRITLSRSRLEDPEVLVATMAHELAHLRLRGADPALQSDHDRELLTDLTAVHLGLGIFLANSPGAWNSRVATWPGTDLVEPTYMTPPMYGWALAHVAWFAGDEDPAWAVHLNRTSGADFGEALRYLFATGDSTFTPPA
jgi:hypothetical protein